MCTSSLDALKYKFEEVGEVLRTEMMDGLESDEAQMDERLRKDMARRGGN